LTTGSGTGSYSYPAAAEATHGQGKRPWRRRPHGRRMRWTSRHTSPARRHRPKSPTPPLTTHRKLHIQNSQIQDYYQRCFLG
jgi:hypothetical protein